MPSVRRVPDAVALLEEHDAFLIDVWGVLHAGGPLHEGVVETLEALAEGGARVMFLSNSSRLGARMTDDLVALGVPRAAFVEVLSSGDVTRAALASREGAVFARCGVSPRVLHVGHAGFVPWLFELGLALTDAPQDADLVIATGAPSTVAKLDAITARLAPLAARAVPLVCTNPDPVIPSPDGRVVLGPGAVARAYEALGGPTFLFGKPHAPIYREALGRLGVPRARVVAIGDMLATDIAGAQAVGLRSVLVTSGVHGTALREGLRDSVLEALFAREGARPDALLERFGAFGTPAASSSGRGEPAR